MKDQKELDSLLKSHVDKEAWRERRGVPCLFLIFLRLLICFNIGGALRSIIRYSNHDLSYCLMSWLFKLSNRITLCDQQQERLKANESKWETREKEPGKANQGFGRFASSFWFMFRVPLCVDVVLKLVSLESHLLNVLGGFYGLIRLRVWCETSSGISSCILVRKTITYSLHDSSSQLF
jgi:hypothetical protein